MIRKVIEDIKIIRAKFYSFSSYSVGWDLHYLGDSYPLPTSITLRQWELEIGAHYCSIESYVRRSVESDKTIYKSLFMIASGDEGLLSLAAIHEVTGEMGRDFVMMTTTRGKIFCLFFC